MEPGYNDFHFQLRAERGDAAGRAYTFTYTAADNRSNVTMVSAVVFVPYDPSGVTDPLEVRVSESAVGTQVSWGAVPAARFYNVVRGSVRNLRDVGTAIALGALACVAEGTTATDTEGMEDTATPTIGDIFFYLVEYDDGRPSSFGTESSMKEYLADAGLCSASP